MVEKTGSVYHKNKSDIVGLHRLYHHALYLPNVIQLYDTCVYIYIRNLIYAHTKISAFLQLTVMKLTNSQ
jgi:hypothetical protein